ncbi:unknown [Harrisina brillians granulovirus]|uniref:Uncharacterized protein n=1 Tax=Harrisina brillians granulovirus TaxID=115813 RepID=Q9JAF1_GVHB|nr:unknown [Harrisina brillians granulovirus]AAF66612.1 unknown [Harrisina brillians granulovirus]
MAIKRLRRNLQSYHCTQIEDKLTGKQSLFLSNLYVQYCWVPQNRDLVDGLHHERYNQDEYRAHIAL